MKRILIILTVMLLFSFTLPKRHTVLPIMTRLQIMQVTIQADVENGLTDSLAAESYLHNISMIIKDIKNENSKTAKLVK